MSVGPLSTLRNAITGSSPDDLRAPVGGVLFLFGAVLGAISLLLQHPPQGEATMWTVSALSGLTGIWWLIAGIRLPVYVIYLGEAGASALISVAILASGVSSGIYSTMYLWIALYSGYFFRGKMAIAQLTWLLGCYGVVLTQVEPGGGYSSLTRWIFTAMTLSVATGMGWALVAQRRRIDAERAALARDRERLLVAAESEARTDPLTGVPNRRALAEQLESELARSRRYSLSFSLAVIDLDNFKQFNDRFGHAEGDALLVEAAREWRQTLRVGDLVARLGGEEFVVLLPQTELLGAEVVIERLRAATPRNQTCSAGIARWNGHEDGEQLLRRADDAMYRAKFAGRDQTALEDDGLDLPTAFASSD